MTVERHACADGLTAACFRAYPDWAKMRFAQKLMHTLFPAEITKRLPQVILDAMEQMPPDWPAGESLPEALSLAPPAGLMPPPGGAIAPLYAAPFGAGPPQVPGGKEAPAEKEPWFYDKFTTLDLTVWTEENYGAGSNTIDAGRLKQYAPSGSEAIIYTADDATIPATFDLTFDLTYDTDDGYYWFVNVYTGEYKIWLAFDPPTGIFFENPAGGIPYEVDNFLGTTDSWKLAWNGTTLNLSRNGIEIITNIIPPDWIGNAGRIELTATEGPTIYLDELKIEEV